MKKVIFLVVVLLANSAFAESRETLRLLDMFGDAFDKVRSEYVEKPSDKELVEAAINGMLTNLDPHSGYLSKERFVDMQVHTKGEFGGLGIEVTIKDGMVYIVSPIDDTPAYKAGLKAGDYISHIDSESVIGMKIGDAVKLMRGKPGTDITLTILREGEKEPMDVKITRAVIKINPVKSKVYEDVAYIRITSFSEKASAGVIEHINKMKKEMGDNLKGVVLDLRNNPGGLLNQSISVADTFLDRGEIVSTRGREKRSEQVFNATRGDEINGLPMVVLINSGSASASEIVAGALQDHGRAVIMGTKSFGKGSVQTIIPLTKDNAIRLTTSRYYTPSGQSIQAKGIVPDITVELAKVEFIKSKFSTSEAKLRGHLKNSDAAKDKKNKMVKKDEEESLYKTDYQLARAIDLLHGIYIFSKGNGRSYMVKK